MLTVLLQCGRAEPSPAAERPPHLGLLPWTLAVRVAGKGGKQDEDRVYVGSLVRPDLVIANVPGRRSSVYSQLCITGLKLCVRSATTEG